MFTKWNLHLKDCNTNATTIDAITNTATTTPAATIVTASFIFLPPPKTITAEDTTFLQYLGTYLDATPDIR